MTWATVKARAINTHLACESERQATEWSEKKELRATRKQRLIEAVETLFNEPIINQEWDTLWDNRYNNPIPVILSPDGVYFKLDHEGGMAHRPPVLWIATNPKRQWRQIDNLEDVGRFLVDDNPRLVTPEEGDLVRG